MVRETIEPKKACTFPNLLLIGALCCVGTFHVYLSCILSAVLLGRLLFVCLIRKKQTAFSVNPLAIALFCLLLFYLLSVFWAVDAGMAFLGFLKFLPLPLYYLLLLEQHRTEEILRLLPWIAAGMTLLSVIGMQLPVVSAWFSVAGRLAGFFQYPNTFALFLLVAELLLVTKKQNRLSDFILIAVLLFGLLYTGSRTVFLLAAAANIVALLIGKKGKGRLLTIAVLVLLTVAAVLYAVLSGNVTAIGRFLTISLKESTFLGRLLYARDALPVILRHPFGLGYMGYYYMEQSLQTGVYSVLYVHNDFLQMLLDVGWAPAIFFWAAAIRPIFRRGAALRTRLILSVVLLHALFDFDLQFIGFFFVLLVFLSEEPCRTYAVPRAALLICLPLLLLVNLYAGTALLLERAGLSATSHAVFPWNTQNEISLMSAEEDLKSAADLADDILQRNRYVTVAYSVKAREAYAAGDFGAVIEQKQKLFSIAPFAYDEYVEYGYMLANGVSLYSQAGDTRSAEVCANELIKLPKRLQAQQSRLSGLGAKIQDQPNLQLPSDLAEFIAELNLYSASSVENPVGPPLGR